MKEKSRSRIMGILVDVFQANCVERTGAPDEAMHLVALGEQKLGEVRTVLTGNAGQQRALRHARVSLTEPLQSQDFERLADDELGVVEQIPPPKSAWLGQ